MATWSTQLFDSDEMQSSVVDLLEAPNPHDVIMEASVLANAEPGDLDLDECYSVLAAAVFVDHLIYNTPVGGHEDGFARMEDEHGATEFTDQRKSLARALERVISPGSALYEEWKAEGHDALRTWQEPIEAMRKRLAGEYHGEQKTEGNEDTY